MNELMKRLEKIAFNKSVAFCYLCYRETPSGRCGICGSDDLMRLVRGVGCEYHLDWIVRHLIDNTLDPIDEDQCFEESVRECYPETTQVGWLTLNTVDTVKLADPISWDISRSEWLDGELSDETVITFDYGSTYFWTRDVEQYADNMEAEFEAAG